jgi:hypothetical protein
MIQRVKQRPLSFSEYVDMYSGTEYNLSLRYVQIIKFVFISFTYGPIIPMVWPLTFVALLN